jgi:hypothetical protein
MMTPRPPFVGPHLADDEILRYIDAEGADEEARRWNDHLATCPRCWREAETLRAQSGALGRWLAMADFERGATPTVSSVATVTPIARGGRRGTRMAAGGRGAASWLKAAVIALLLAAPVVAIPAARELGAGAGSRLGASRSRRPPPPLTAPAGAGTTAIRFVPDPGTFTLVLDAAQAEGSLRVGRTSGAEAVLEVRGHGVLPEPTVSARSVRISNTEATTVSYALSLPSGVEMVRVEIGGRQILLDAETVGRSATIPLHGSGPGAPQDRELLHDHHVRQDLRRDQPDRDHELDQGGEVGPLRSRVEGDEEGREPVQRSRQDHRHPHREQEPRAGPVPLDEEAEGRDGEERISTMKRKL